MIQFLEFPRHVKIWSDDPLSWKPNSFDLVSDVPELVPSVSDMIVDSEYFAVRPDKYFMRYAEKVITFMLMV